MNQFIDDTYELEYYEELEMLDNEELFKNYMNDIDNTLSNIENYSKNVISYKKNNNISIIDLYIIYLMFNLFSLYLIYGEAKTNNAIMYVDVHSID